ncbi:MAG: tRNA dimethylallyltransferase, partial [Ilumatobacter sp.]
MAVAAQLGDVELISVDSMQVYRGLDIGTAKPSPEDQAAIRHHCIDIAEATAEFTVAEFKRAHASALGHIEARG